MDLIQFDALRRALYACADEDIETIASINQLTDSMYELVAAGQQVRLEIGLSDECNNHSVHLVIE